MCVARRAYESPNIRSISGGCESPMPSVKRPRQAAPAVSACCARAAGCRGWVGTTAVPISMRRVSRPATAAAVTASKPKTCAIQSVEKPRASSSTARATRSSRPPR
jgi:hypothetical protein